MGVCFKFLHPLVLRIKDMHVEFQTLLHITGCIVLITLTAVMEMVNQRGVRFSNFNSICERFRYRVTRVHTSKLNSRQISIICSTECHLNVLIYSKGMFIPTYVRMYVHTRP